MIENPMIAGVDFGASIFWGETRKAYPCGKCGEEREDVDFDFCDSCIADHLPSMITELQKTAMENLYADPSEKNQLRQNVLWLIEKELIK